MALAVMPLLLVGCAQDRPFDDLFIDARPYHADTAASRPPTDVLDRGHRPAYEPAMENPDGPITLRDAVGLALRQSPALAASGWNVAAMEADALQRGRAPNPRASVAVENLAGPDGGDLFERTTLRLSQVIELAGKREKRLALGRAEQRLAAWDYEAQRLDVAASTAERYVRVAVAQELLTLAERQLELAQSGYDIAQDRFDQGAAPGLERDQAAARLALSRIDLEQARQDLEAARADLAASWGGKQARFDTVAADLESRGDLPMLDELEARLDQAPQVARWADEIERRERAVALQRANAVTDPTAGAGVRYFPDADDAAAVFELSWPLAVFDDNRHGILAARLRVAQAQTQAEQARVEAKRQLANAHAATTAAAFALTSLDQDALPASRTAYDAALEAYRAGQADYLVVLDSERTLLDISRRRLTAARSYHTALIRIEQLTGQAAE